ncbi:MAG TPA: VCBS repeat-containing protein [Terriglobales bacterium]|nr:VCBS repeat-containing protein [Terriglobales bacterium]
MFSKVLKSSLFLVTISLLCSIATAQHSSNTPALQPRNGNFATNIVISSPVTAQKDIAPPANQLFQHPVRYDTAGYDPFAVAVGDFNSDGNADVVVANQEMYGAESSVGILLGNGDGTFQTATSFDAAGELAYSVAVADVNGDGHLDVLVADGCASGTGTNCSPQGVLAVFLGNGDGTFQPAKTYSTGASDLYHSIIAVADLNADHKLDVVVAHGCGGLTCTNGSVSVLLGDGTGGFSTAASYGSGGNGASAVVVADMNGDHKPDLVAVNWCSALCGTSTPIEGSVGVLLGNGNGTFQPAVAYLSGGNGTRAVSVSDLNRDGKVDVLTASCGPDACAPGFPGGTAGVLLGNGDGTLQSAMADNAGNSPDAIAAVDLNGDGKKDLVVGNWGTTDGASNKGSITILLGSGDGTFHATKTLLAGGNEVPSIAIADLNGDGHPDVVTADIAGTFNYNTNGSVSVFLNNQP